MKITIKPEALQYLNKKADANAHLFLALDDGSSKFSKLGGSCAIGNKYQLVVSAAADADYDVSLTNDAGLHLTTGMPETMYFEAGLTLDYKNASLQLRDNSGILDGAVMVSTYEAPKDDDARRQEMQALGGKIC